MTGVQTCALPISGAEGHIDGIFPAKVGLSEGTKGKSFLGGRGIDKAFVQSIDPIKGFRLGTVGDQIGGLGKVALLYELKGGVPLAEFVFLETKEMVLVAFPLGILYRMQRSRKEKQSKDKEA